MVAVIAPVNESVWEHLNLVLIPVVALGGVEAAWVVERGRLWWAKLAEVITASGFIVAFFYTYTGAFGVVTFTPPHIPLFQEAATGAYGPSGMLAGLYPSPNFALARSSTAWGMRVSKSWTFTQVGVMSMRAIWSYSARTPASQFGNSSVGVTFFAPAM